jgi:pimeloyl-ACP methyl ester carboxylesterase
MIVHGALDRIAPSAEVERLAQAFPRLPRIIEVEGARHTDVFDQGGEKLEQEIADFAEAATSHPSGQSSARRQFPEAN